MSVTAEGVETAEDFERMRDLGCDIIQGYHISRPMDLQRVFDWLAARPQSDRATGGG